MRKEYAMSKKLRFVILCILLLSLCISENTSYAKDVEKYPSINKPFSSGLYFDFVELIEYRAEKGLKNLEPHSLILINEGLKAYNKKRQKEAAFFLEKARELSPDLPLTYIYLTSINFSFSKQGFAKSSEYLLGAVKAFLNNFWWSFQTTGIFSLSMFLAFYISGIFFLITLSSSKLRLYIHDSVEDKRKILYVLPSVILILLGPIFGLIGFIIPFWVYFQRKEKAVVLGIITTAALILVAVPWLFSLPGVLQDRAVFNVAKINEGVHTGEIPELIDDEDSYETAFTYALDLKRKGYYAEAATIYKNLLTRYNDGRIYNNLANCFIGIGDYETAIKYYNKALQLTKMASTYYNLSQIYRESFDFDKADEYYLRATEIDPLKVNFFNEVKGRSVNRFVMDETLSTKDLWLLSFRRAENYKSTMLLKNMLSFIGREFSVVLLFLSIIGFLIYNQYVSYKAYSCLRCGKIYCSKCEKKMSRENVCRTCFKTLIRMGELTPQERVEKILEVQRYKNNKKRIIKILTFIFPGSGHVYHGWTVYGLLLMVGITFFLISGLLWLYIPAHVSMNLVSSVFKWVSISGFIIMYLTTVINILRRVR
jgi:tetratricopeptide (TPR) repeat protein